MWKVFQLLKGANNCGFKTPKIKWFLTPLLILGNYTITKSARDQVFFLGWVKMQQMTKSGRETWDGRRNHWKRRVRQLGTTFLPQNNAIQFINQIIIYDIKKTNFSLETAKYRQQVQKDTIEYNRCHTKSCDAMSFWVRIKKQ